MLAGLRSSVCKITMLFRRSPEISLDGGSRVEQSVSHPFPHRSGFSTALTRKLQQRRAFYGSHHHHWSTRIVQEQKQNPTTTAAHPTHHHTLQIPTEHQSGGSFGDVFASLDLADSPTTPFGIKAFNDAPSQSLSEHCSVYGSADRYVVQSLNAGARMEERLVDEANASLASMPPKLCGLGTGGVYFLRSASGETVAVFKPTDEEPRGVNNPKGYKNDDDVHDSLREGIHSGEGAVRERAAFLLDHASISGVPTTTMVSMTSAVDSEFEKTGSLQRYVPFDYDAEECGTGLFSVEDVHKICLADIRYVNTDRNGQNILVTREEDGRTRLTPIDHGYCFPDSLKDLYFEWMHWPQAKQPFSPTLMKFIEDLDPEADLELLRDHNILFRPECNQVFLFVNYLLKWSVRRNCTPRDIAFILSDSSSSVLDGSFKLAVELSRGVVAERQVYESLDHHAEALMTCTRDNKS